MAIKEDINNAVDSILDNHLDIDDVDHVPDIEDNQLTFGMTGKRIRTVCLFIDMRGSTAILEKHNANVVIKIHKAYFISILKIVRSLNGEVRSFNGDSILAFFIGDDSNSIEAAIKAAMKIKHILLIDKNCLKNKITNKYNTEIDIGIGLDLGTTTVAKVGFSGNNNRDLIWIGSNVNRAVKISDGRRKNHNIGITERLYSNLTNNVKFSNGRNIWTYSFYNYNNWSEAVYITDFHWGL